MSDSLAQRIKNSWNVFRGRDPTNQPFTIDYGASLGSRPDRTFLTRGNERSIINAVYNRISVDCAKLQLEHVRLDEKDNFKEVITSTFNNCLTLRANIDQSSFAFMQDLVISMLDEGRVAVVPTVIDLPKGITKRDPMFTDQWKIEEMRVGKIVEWFPRHVRVDLYNDLTGKHQELILSKREVAIIENPFYSVMNEPNSMLQRLIRTLNHLDRMNKDNASGKLDLILQLPYSTRNEEKRRQAERRRRDVERQLAGSKYGIAYTDATEKVVQLNRAVENNMWNEAKELIELVYSQLGLSENILKGTASEQEILYYYDHTIDPIMNAIVLEFKEKFLSQTARTQRQDLMYFRDPFKLVPAKDLAEIADKFTRNAILSSNEIRAEIGYKPVDEPIANELSNKNLNADKRDSGDAEIGNEEVEDTSQ